MCDQEKDRREKDEACVTQDDVEEEMDRPEPSKVVPGEAVEESDETDKTGRGRVAGAEREEG